MRRSQPWPAAVSVILALSGTGFAQEDDFARSGCLPGVEVSILRPASGSVVEDAVIVIVFAHARLIATSRSEAS